MNNAPLLSACNNVDRFINKEHWKIQQQT